VKLLGPTAVPVRAEEIAMKRLCIYRAGFLLALVNFPMKAEAGTLGPSSRGAVAISVTIAPHFVMSQSARANRTAVGDPAEPLCMVSTGSAPYGATLLTEINGRSEELDLPLLRNDQLTADQQNCRQELGTAVYVDRQFLRVIRESSEPVMLLIVPN
jgi:hypothetical protein